MTGGNEQQFFDDYWRKRTLLAKGCFPQLDQYYSASEFLEDYRRLDYHNATFLIVISNNEANERHFEVPKNWVAVEGALKQGIPMAVLALNLPEGFTQRPRRWDHFISFHESLRNYVCGDFPILPRGQVYDYLATASVDFFYTSPKCQETTTGGHYDTGDVFYFVLEGEKEWTVEFCPDSETTKSLQRLPGGKWNLTSADRSPVREHMDVTLTPGDCLYVPPYTYHRVRSNGASLAVSLGLPTFNEVTLLGYHLMQLQFSKTLYDPLPSFPHTHGNLHATANEETRSRMLAVLNALADSFR